ncbi:MAG: glutamate synthase subunit beta [Sebaldella sp.]|nr:glutamate synthase subunit beta [Sebaldella sp.]
MGKNGGFLEIKRKEKEIRNVTERITDFHEINLNLEDEYIKEQAARCMDCGIPFCHMACPVDNICPEWQDLAYNNEWERALEVLQSTNNFPEFTGRVCPAPCEGSCTLGINDKPVAIKNIELAIIEKGFEMGWIKPKVAEIKTGKKIAVIGSGPAGLTAAQNLARLGHTVIVYEKDERAGGLLTFGIPDFKLEKWIIERRIKQMEQEDVIFKYNIEVGKDISLKDLEREYDAVVLACGSKQPRDLGIKGRELHGINYAMDFLTQQNRKNNGIDIENEYNINTSGKRVLVIGGGDTGADCVGTSARQGAKNVIQIEILDKPPVNRGGKNPWPQYPVVLKMSTSHEEADKIYGKDPREWNIITKEFIGDKNGNVSGIKVAKAESFLDKNGRLSFKEIENSDFIIEVDIVFLAIGFIHTVHEGLIKMLNLELDERGNVKADDLDYKTSIEKYFAAGDIRRGQSLVVWAIREGRDAAKAVDSYLVGK